MNKNISITHRIVLIIGLITVSISLVLLTLAFKDAKGIGKLIIIASILLAVLNAHTFWKTLIRR